MVRTAYGVGACAILFAAVALAAPAKEGDPLPVGSKWKGTLTQKGEIGGVETPLELETTLTVTKRDGDKFEAELFETTRNLRLTYVVRGTVRPIDRNNPEKGWRVEFESVDSKGVENTEAITKIPYTATLKGKVLKGTWKYPANAEGTTLEGTFEFEKSK